VRSTANGQRATIHCDVDVLPGQANSDGNHRQQRRRAGNSQPGPPCA
jgi:hypothetical protein